MSYPSFDCDCPQGYMDVRYYTEGGIEHSSGITSSFTTANYLVALVYLGPRTHMYDAVGNVIAVNYNDWCEQFTPYVRKNSLVFSSANLPHDVAWRYNKVDRTYESIDEIRFKMCADIDNNGFEHFGHNYNGDYCGDFGGILMLFVVVVLVILMLGLF